jgi:hypothetical protein
VIDTAAIAWLADSPGEEARRALEAWGRARGVRLAPPGEERAPLVAIDWSAGERVEQEIARARDALAGLDFDAAERSLARADATLREHPELPQGAWLRAEVERGWSARWLRAGSADARGPAPEDVERAKRAWQRGAALDGGREPGLGERAFEPAAAVTATLRVEGDGAPRLDGAAVLQGLVQRGEGEHLLAVVRPDGGTVWAGWVSLAQGSVIRVAAEPAAACSRADLRRAHVERGAVLAPGVQCGRWVAAIPASPGAVDVALCEGETCGPLATWRASSPLIAPAPGPGQADSSRGGWPAWATWTVAGVGVAGAALAIVAAAGAFKPAPSETHFVNGGLQIHSF